MQPEAGELVEHAQRERGDVAGVGEVEVVAGGEVQDARAPHVLEQRRIAVGQQPLEEDPLAQPRLGGLQGVEAAGPQHPLHDDRSGQDQVGARRLDARDAAALGRGQRREPLHQLVERIALDHHALHAVGGQARGALDGGREVAHRPADADQAPRAARRDPPSGSHARLLELGGDVVAQLLDLPALGGPFGGQEALGHAHRAHAPGAGLAREPLGHAHELHRAAAEVQHVAVVSVVELTAAM